ncbi:MAG: SPFH domain-containing protein, partial [Acidobacteriota bacterium]
PADGTKAIRLGSQLIVEESQQAVFFRDGKALDTFGPGRHTLATQNVPILASVFGLPFGGDSPFQAAVVFVSTRTFLDLKWGTKEPVAFRDQELAMVRLRAFGKYAVRIVNAQVFVNTVVGTLGTYSTERLEDWFRDVIVARLTDVLGENLTSIFDLPKLYDELAMGLKARVAEDFTKYGVELVDLYMGAVTAPEEVQKLIDERSGMAALGDMNTYLKFKTARAIGDAAQASGSGDGGGVSAGLGVGMGAGLGMMLPQMMREAMQGGGGGAAGPAPAGAPAAPAAPPAGGAGAATSAVLAGGGGEPGATPAFCSNCGQKLAPGTKFCPSCGTKVA